MDRYARFYKCDLHMHSPADHSWRDTSTRLRPDTPQAEREAVARQYIEACYDAGLEVIAVVDHNFAPEPELSLVPLLCQANQSMATERGVTPLLILPGFEAECHVGKGGHVVCLFDPETPINTVNDAASKLLPATRFANHEPFPSGQNLQQVLRVIQDDLGGMVIGAHCDRDKGLMEKDTAEHWWRQEEFRRPEFYAVELHKPPCEFNAGGFLHRVLANAEPGWERERPIGCVMSSDCKRLHADTQDDRNHIGCRFTWIRMSHPCVEGLRQAFLGRDTHVRFGDECPDLQYVYPRIEYVRFAGGFLRVPELRFSPNLNCVIGGRGSGKSTLVDAVRAAGERVNEDMPEGIRNSVIDRLGRTIGGAVVEVGVKSYAGRRVLRLDWTGGGQVTVLDENGAVLPGADVQTLFPARFLSQGEIDALAQRKEGTLALGTDRVAKLLDDFVEPALHELQREEERVRSDLTQLDAEIAQLRSEIEERARIEAEIAEIEGKLSRLDAVEAELGYWEAVQDADEGVQAVEGSIKQAQQVVQETLARVEELRTVAGSHTHTPLAEVQPPPGVDTQRHEEAVRAAEGLAQGARVALSIVANQLRGAISGLEGRALRAASPFQVRLRGEWRPFVSEAEGSRDALKANLRAQGLDPDEYERLQQELSRRQTALAEVVTAEKRLVEKRKVRKQTVERLHSLWARQTEARAAKANELNGKLQGVLTISVCHQGSVTDLIRLLEEQELWKDKRRMSQDDWNELLSHLRASRQQNQPLAVMFANEVRRLQADGSGPIAYLWGAEERRASVLHEWFPEAVLEQVETVSVADEVEMVVCDSQGNPLGSLANVSTGQRGLAVLSLMLAEGDCPLVIDTPEEGLDNEGVYALLVPLLREKKEQRQIVVVTHNANIPVNADAELIVALEATKDGEGTVHGQLKGVPEVGGVRPAIGALDREEVVRAVVDIMEGSRDAFSRRRVKYGY